MPRIWHSLVIAAVAVCLASCGVRPARPDVPVTPARPLSGDYIATIHTTYVGPIRARMVAEPTEEGFKANTTPGVAWSLLSGAERLLGPVLAPYVFPSGMIMTWRSTLPSPGEPGRGTIGVGSLASLRASTVTRSPGGPTEVRWKDGRLLALITLEPAANLPREPMVDYRALAARVSEEVGRRYYDPKVASSRAMRSYLEVLANAAEKSNDDIEFMFAAGFAARKNIARYGTPLIYPGERANTGPFAGAVTPPKPFLVTRDAPTGLVTLRMDAFMEDAMVDEALNAALSPTPTAMVLDLRTCPGVRLSVVRAASRLSASPVDLGVYADAAHVGSPPVKLVGDNGDDAEEFLRRAGTLQLESKPAAGAYTGPLAILTSRRTSSSAEVFAAAMKASGRAITVGENTAGRPMLSAEVAIGQGWLLRVGAYGYCDASGKLLEGGVPPTVRATKELAPGAAARALGLEVSERDERTPPDRR